MCGDCADAVAGVAGRSLYWHGTGLRHAHPQALAVGAPLHWVACECRMLGAVAAVLGAAVEEHIAIM